MKIADIKTFVIKVAAKKAYRMALMAEGGEDYLGFVVKVTTDTGVSGFGEVFVTPGWYAPDTPFGMIGIVERVFKPALVGIDVLDTERVVTEMDRVWAMGNLFAKSAVDMAVHDAAARTIGRPVCDLMGGRLRTRFALAGGIGHDTPEGMAASARSFADRGFKTIKLKIGAKHDPDLDIARVRVVREEIGPGIKLRLDANGVYTVPEAIKLIRKLERYDIDHVEQPVAGWNVEGMAEIRAAIDVPLMADESVHSVADAYRVVKARAADVVKIKIAKTGGYRRSQEIIAICASAGLDVVIGNGINASMQALAELHLACSHAAIQPAGEFIGPDKLVSDVVKTPLVIDNGEAILPDAPGCGTEVDEEKLKAHLIESFGRKAA